MPDALNLADLANLSREDRHAQLSALASRRAAPLNGEIDALDRTIAEYERQFAMSSESMLELLHSGERDETADICAWMRLVDVRSRLSKRPT
jgi:hypothetical protein